MRIAWLEQSGELQNRESLISALKSEDVAFFRYNWKHGKSDPFANVFSPIKCSWSKGRERLYDAACPGKFDYYLFVDDDTVFDVSAEEAIRTIKRELRAHDPDVLTICRKNCWQERYLRDYSRTVRIFATDLQLQVIKAELAAATFPALFDGGWGTLWYPMFLANKRKGGGVINVRGVSIRNTRINDTGEYGGVENQNSQEIWRRSEAYMPLHARLAGRLFGFQRAMQLLNAAYAKRPLHLHLRPKRRLRSVLQHHRSR